MPKDFIRETGITIDYEQGVMLVDTTVARDATHLRRMGFTETTAPENRPYRRFRGQPDQIRFRQPKGQRRVRGIAKTRLESLSEKAQAA